MRSSFWNYLRFFCSEKCAYYLLFIHSFIYISMDYGYLFHILGYNPILPYLFSCSRSFQLWPLGTLSAVSLYPFHIYSVLGPFCLSLCVYVWLWALLLFSTIRCSRLILCITCPSPRVSQLSKECRSFDWSLIRNQHLGVGFAIATGYFCFWALSTDRSKKYMCMSLYLALTKGQVKIIDFIMVLKFYLIARISN